MLIYTQRKQKINYVFMIYSTTSLLKVDTLYFKVMNNSIFGYITCNVLVGTCCLISYLDFRPI